MCWDYVSKLKDNMGSEIPANSERLEEAAYLITNRILEKLAPHFNRNYNNEYKKNPMLPSNRLSCLSLCLASYKHVDSIWILQQFPGLLLYCNLPGYMTFFQV